MTLQSRDQAILWHPYTQHHTSLPPIAISRAKGIYLITEDNKKYMDLISSWWVNIHGHCHPEIAKTIYEQAMTLEQVIFAGFTHEPAVVLAENILRILPSGFNRVFYSDNGSTAVEVALKMAYQYWRNQGEGQRHRFIAFENGYHGDTFGAMSVGKRSGFFSHFLELLFAVDTFAYPATWIGDELVKQKEQTVLNKLAEYLQKYSAEVAALIIEPLVQGASGMHMCTPRFMREIEKLVRSHGILIIYDEAMTGFGRTGKYFACTTAQTTPDIICLAKSISGGFLPLAMTVCSEKIYAAFLDNSPTKMLTHGHSFMANPLGCAAGIASLKLLEDEKVQSQIKMIQETHTKNLLAIAELELIEKPRLCGTISAFNFKVEAQYGSQESIKLQQRFLNNGLLLRPLGNAIYLLPPYCITQEELSSAYNVIIQEIQGVVI
jgi:adenosylmethionine-8-amino-7-oxononanoate aminotransferase